MEESKELKIANELCGQILELTAKGILKLPDLLEMTDLCIEACKREKAEIEKATRPSITIVQ